jgi:hypothetical protein
MANNPRSTRRDRSDDPPPPSYKTEGGDEKSEFKKPSFWITVATFLVVGGYTYFAHQQVTETQTANLIAKQALTEANKPYVMLTALSPNYTSDTNGIHLRLGFTLTNYGNTPAHFVRFTSCEPIIRADASPDIHCNKTSAPGDPTDLGPKQFINISGEIVKDEDMEATKDAKKSVYVLGYVTYQDSIDMDANNLPEQRETRFCLKAIRAIPKLITTPTTPNPKSQPNIETPAPTSPPQPSSEPPPEAFPPIVGQACPAFSCMDKTCKPFPN